MTLQVGDMFAGRYRIDARLGAGGFGVVYRATDVRSQRAVALKVLQSADEQARARFAREVAIVGRLESPHTVALLDSGVAGDQHFAVFELIEGRDLSEVLNEYGTLTEDVVEHVLRQLLHALHEAHQHHLLHRDIKPENIRVTAVNQDPWRVKLLDFGIARATDGAHPSLTSTGELVGTPRYMSPEQLTERPLGPASDIYSLGMVAFEMLAGRGALQGGAWSDQLDRLDTGYLNPALLGQESALTPLIVRMTRRNPAQRLGSVHAVLQALDGVSPTRPVVEVRTERSRSMSRRRIVAIALGCTLLALLAFFMWSDVPEEEPASVRKTHANYPTGLLKETETATLPAQDAGPREKPVERPAVVSRRSSGCGEEVPFTGAGQLTPRLSFQLGSWLGYVPASVGRQNSTPLPLIVLLHDDKQDPADLLNQGGWSDLAERRGFAVVAPQSRTGLVLGTNAWRGNERMRVSSVVNETTEQLCIDQERIYVVVQGRGGRLAEKLMCEPWVRAVARSGYRQLDDEFHGGCEPDRPLMILSGNQSRHMPVHGGRNCFGNTKESLATEEEILRTWNRCRGDADSWYEAEHGRCQTWACEQPFVSCTLDGGADWPGVRNPRVECEEEPPPADFPSTERVWAFFEQLAGEGCGTLPPFTGRGELKAEGMEPWLTYVPEGADATPMPLVVLLHQAEETAEIFFEDTEFARLADEHQFVVIAPSGVKLTGLNAWKRSDPAQLSRIVQQTSRQLCIDRTRQFVVGHGQGGNFAQKISCTSWIDGMATNSHRSKDPDHRCARSVPHIALSGMKTAHEPVDGGLNCRGMHKISLDEWEQSWAERNKCGDRSPQPTFEHRGSQCYDYSDCEASLTTCHLNGGHGWPGSSQRPTDELLNCDGEPPDFPTEERIWEFFRELD